MPQKQLHDVRRSGHCTTNYERTTLLIHSSITRPTVHILLDCKRELYTKLVARSLCVHITSTVCSHIHTYRLTALFPGTTRVSRYQKGKTDLDFTEARDSEWQWHQLGHMQVSTSLQANNHASTPLLSFFTGRMPFLSPNQQRQSTQYSKISTTGAADATQGQTDS